MWIFLLITKFLASPISFYSPSSSFAYQDRIFHKITFLFFFACDLVNLFKKFQDFLDERLMNKLKELKMITVTFIYFGLILILNSKQLGTYYIHNFCGVDTFLFICRTIIDTQKLFERAGLTK